MKYWILHIKSDRTLYLVLQTADDGSKKYIEFHTRPSRRYAIVSAENAAELLQGKNGRSKGNPPSQPFGSLTDLCDWLGNCDMRAVVRTFMQSDDAVTARVKQGE